MTARKIILISGLCWLLLAVSTMLGAQAHDLKRYGAGSAFTNSAGKIRFQLTNSFDRVTKFEIQVVDRNDFMPIDPDHWRSDIASGKDQDTVELQPGETRIITLQLRHRGMRVKVCSKAGSGIATRFCKGAHFL